MTDVVRLARPLLGDEGAAAVRAVLETGHLTLGPALARFEAVLGDACEAHAVAVANGTAALHLALLANEVREGDEVIVPAYTFPATANVVVHCGARPVFCDVHPGLDVATADEIAARITHRTKAIMVVHLFGFPVPMDGVLALAEEYGLPVIEDAAGALGSQSASRPCGSIGRAGCLSFHPRKIVTTGEGGAVLTRDAALAERIRMLRHHGLGPTGFGAIGLNYRLADPLAALGTPQVERLATLVTRRRAQAAAYDAALVGIAGIEPPPHPTEPGDVHSYQAYVARLTEPARRDDVIAGMRERGVETQIGTYCVPALVPYLARGHEPADTPHAVDAQARGLALPLYDGLTDAEQERVVGALSAVLG